MPQAFDSEGNPIAVGAPPVAFDAEGTPISRDKEVVRLGGPPPMPSTDWAGGLIRGVGKGLAGAIPEGIKHPSIFLEAPGAAAFIIKHGYPLPGGQMTHDPYMAMLAQAGRDIGAQMQSGYEKGKGLFPGSGLVTGGVSAFAPGAPEAGEKIGEGVGTGDTEKMAEGIGQGATIAGLQALPLLSRGARGLPRPPEGVLSEAAQKSFARATRPLIAADDPVTLEMAQNAGRALASEPEVSFSTKSLGAKIDAKLKELGPAVREAVEAHKADPIAGAALAKQIRGKARDLGYIDSAGEVYEAKRPQYEALMKFADEVQEKLGRPDANLGDLHQLKKTYDSTIASDKNWQEPTTQARREAMRVAANELRDFENTHYQDIRQANAAYGPWADAKTLNDQAILRDRAKEWGVRGGAGGAHLGSPAYWGVRAINRGGTPVEMVGLLGINKLRNSPFWNTLMGTIHASQPITPPMLAPTVAAVGSQGFHVEELPEEEQ